MARQRRVEAPVPPNGFIASAAVLPSIRPRSASTAQGWQMHAWLKHDAVAELRYIANWRGAAMSRAALTVMRAVPDGYEKITDGPAAEALDAYFGGAQGQAGMLHTTGVNHTVAGEAYHIYLADEDQYYVLPCDAVSQHHDKVTAVISGERVPIGSSDLCIRVWVPHPRTPEYADSPVRSNLGTLDQITRLNDHIASQLDSRLTGAGILFMPSEIQFAVPEGMDPQSNQADAFMTVLGETMAASIKDRGSASAIVPIVVTAPGESLDKVQHLTFWSQLDAAAIEMLDSAIRRLALGMDVPPEVLLGTTESNHWGMWLMDDAAIKTHIEPGLAVISHALTTAYLRPAIMDEVADPESYYVMADTSSIRLRPNRSNEAIELFDRGALSADALRRETGFDGGDRPSEFELRAWLLRKTATGAVSPEQAAAALRALGVDLGEAGGPGSSNGERSRMVRDRRQPDVPRAVEEKKQREQGLSAACEGLVLHALTRVGNKLSDPKARARGIGAHPAHERHVVASGPPDYLLEGSWEFAEELLAGMHPQPAAVVTTLDLYVRGLIEAKVPHTRGALEFTLQKMDGVTV